MEGETPRLIDEWQEVEPIWDAVRYEVDRRGTPGQFILTGSSTPHIKDQRIHSGAGRIARLKLRTMSLCESGDSSGVVSLTKLCNGQMNEHMIGEVSLHYWNQRPFSSKVRSSVRIKQAEKRHFCDPSLPCAILGLTPEHLIQDLETFGFMFEALCECDLKIYAESFGGKLFHYQDYANREIDAVIEMKDGRWCAFEIKLGAHQIDAAAEGLLELRDTIAAEGGNVPEVLCVVCGLTRAAYRRPDGVFVVPITALKN